ncbi:salicylate hydroxylase [Pestalotiopsis sp. NC0098]|nr:salicylate hydroxylase [Pestalotiopsis sp. NC0098]
MDSTSKPQIAIIGAGPAGLTLGLLLHRQGVPFRIYDLRARPTEEEFTQQSGMLNLNEGTGLSAVRACNLYDEFIALTGECQEADVIADMNDNILYADAGSGGRPEISRHDLTRLLLSHIPAESIAWEHKLVKATPTASASQYVLDFGSRGTSTVDLVVGADGAWSRIRAQLTDKKPHYSGVTFMTLTVPDFEARYPQLAEFVGPGTFAAPGDGNVVMCQRGVRGAARIYLSFKTSEDGLAEFSGLGKATAAEAKKKLLSLESGDSRWTTFGSFGPKLQELITIGLENQSGPLDIKPLYMLPVGELAWQHKAGVTLIGDAAHLMTPFAGEGVNLAMRDALDISAVIKNAWDAANSSPDESQAFHKTLESGLPGIEKELFERSEETAEQTFQNLGLFTSPGAAPKLAEFFSSHGPPPEME